MRGFLPSNEQGAVSPSMKNPKSAAPKMGKLTVTIPIRVRRPPAFTTHSVKSGNVRRPLRIRDLCHEFRILLICRLIGSEKKLDRDR
jgi:hypothetical protein